MLALKPQVRPGFLELALFAGPVDVVQVGVDTPTLDVTFDLLPSPLHWPGRGPPSPVQSVNEAEDPGGMAGTVWLKERLSVCERLLNVWRWTCSTHAGSFLENGPGSLRNRMVLLRACSCPSLPAQLPVY